jgi:hypothetical protein
MKEVSRSSFSQDHAEFRWFGVLSLAFLLTGCAAGASNFDPAATERLGRISSKKTAGTFTREVEPIGGSSAVIAVGGYIGWVIARGLLAERSSVTVFEYGVKLDDGDTATVVSEWGAFENGACVKVFETHTARKDYPRLATASGCKP